MNVQRKTEVKDPTWTFRGSKDKKCFKHIKVCDLRGGAFLTGKSHFTFKLTRRCQVVNADYLLVIVDPLVTVHEDGCHARGGAVDGNN